ncbi:MAG: hypothetical protein Q4C42_04430 [Clostridia bacterium]|nr:hypothetical protein [Clostridia bacterium]
MDFYREPFDVVCRLETYRKLYDSLLSLSARERMYLYYRYGFDGCPRNIINMAREFSLTYSMAKKIDRESLGKLKNNFIA